MSDYIDTVDIEGTQYDIQDTPTKEQTEENTQRIEELENLDIYSLEEIDTSKKWVDNKPIYKKTFVITSNFTESISLPVNTDTLVSIQGIGIQTSGNTTVFPFSGNSTSTYNGWLFSGYYNHASKTFVPEFGSIFVSALAKLVLTFEYTKSA